MRSLETRVVAAVPRRLGFPQLKAASHKTTAGRPGHLAYVSRMRDHDYMATTTEKHLANVAIEKQVSAARAFADIQDVRECRWTPSWQEDAAKRYAAARASHDQLVEHLAQLPR